VGRGGKGFLLRNFWKSSPQKKNFEEETRLSAKTFVVRKENREGRKWLLINERSFDSHDGR